MKSTKQVIWVRFMCNTCRCECTPNMDVAITQVAVVSKSSARVVADTTSWHLIWYLYLVHENNGMLEITTMLVISAK
ncbi:hypothetical protein HanHA89_Chr12g0456071 [Helianthus annuus]|nr:hypothetical protein HanHA89_Chr12g0456071 [Helianthus annuus]